MNAPSVHHHAGPSQAWRNITSRWQDQRRQRSRARIERINTIVYVATIATTNFRYLFQGNVQIVKRRNTKEGDKTQQTHCRQWSIPGAWLHGSITSWWSRYSFHKVQDRITLIRDNSVDFQPLDTVVDRNKFRGSNLCLKLMGLRYIDSSPLEGQSLPKDKYNLQS